MKARLFFPILLFFCSLQLYAQVSPASIRDQVWDIHALRYSSLSIKADSIIEKVIFHGDATSPWKFQQISANLVINKQFLQDQISYSTAANDLIYKYILKPYHSWLQYTYPINEYDLALPVALIQKVENKGNVEYLSRKVISDLVGYDNLEYLLEETLKNADLWKSGETALVNGVKSPLDKEHTNDYAFFLSSMKEIDSIKCFEIAFFSKNLQDRAFEGYLYVSSEDYSLMKAVFTLNFSVRTGKIKEILFTQNPSGKMTQAFLGDEIQGSVMVEKQSIYDENFQKEILSKESETLQNLEGLIQESKKTRAYRNLENTMAFLLTGNLRLHKFELGPLLHSVSYNEMEGLRLRAGGYTSDRLNPHFQVGGYVAYGFKDERWKYRGDIIFKPHISDIINFSYIEDLNIPGYNLLTSRRDHILYSLVHSGNDNMSWQKLGHVNYEKKLGNAFSFSIGGRYLYDEPMGNIRYMSVKNEIPEIIPEITTNEVNFSLRFAPGEKYIYVGNKKIYFKRPDFALQLNHRIGLKDVFDSDYSYQITKFDLLKKILFPANSGSLSLRASAGKVWNRLPFPLLFIPAGNQSYVFDPEYYNLMNFYEFVTDNYVAASLNTEWNWSPLNLFSKSASVKTVFGAKTLYGPMSNRNNPEHNSQLFVFNNGVRALGDQPYTEINAGFANIFRFLRIDYVYRLNYGEKGALFFTSSYIF